jgi:hypothetical protein
LAEAYWTHCMYCHCLICGVEVLEDYPDVLVLYAHKTCHEERKPVDPDAVWTMLCESLEASPKNQTIAICAIMPLTAWKSLRAGSV